MAEQPAPLLTDEEREDIGEPAPNSMRGRLRRVGADVLDRVAGARADGQAQVDEAELEVQDILMRIGGAVRDAVSEASSSSGSWRVFAAGALFGVIIVGVTAVTVVWAVISLRGSL